MKHTGNGMRKLLLGATVLASAVAIAACCKSGNDSGNETPTADPTATTPPTETTAEPAPETVDPGWKQKCPDAERPESGTVTALKQLQVFEAPNGDAKKTGDIVPGTWVNLLGAKGTWYCIDYPCDVGKLCPGWVEERYTKRKPPEPKDAGPDALPDAAPDAPADTGPEAGDAALPDGGKIRFPIHLDAGKPATTGTGGTTGTAPPGGRPPTPPKPK